MLDAYARKARLYPALLAALPALLLVGAGATTPTRSGSLLAMTVGVLGVVVCGLVRDAGRRLQPAMWTRWGGSPTVARLRHRPQDGGAVKRLHTRVEAVTGLALPTADEQSTDPAAADARLDEAVGILRE